MASAAAADVPHHKLDLSVDVEYLDTCHLGHHKYATSLLHQPSVLRMDNTGSLSPA